MGSLLALGAGSAIGAGVQGFFGSRSAKKQLEAAEAARRDAQRIGSLGLKDVRALNDRALGEIEDANEISDLRFVDAIAANNQGTRQSTEALGPLLDLLGFQSQASSTITPFDVTGAGGRLSGLLDEGLFEGFEESPGFEFRRDQGEQAINRAAAARGGRASGETLAALLDFNQNLASDEFDRFANRRIAQAQTAGSADAQDISLAFNQAGREDSAQQAGIQNALSLTGVGADAQRRLSDLLFAQGQTEVGISQARGANELSGAQAIANLLQNQGSQETQLRGIQAGASTIPVQFAGQGSAAVGNAAAGLNQNLSTLALLGMLG